MANTACKYFVKVDSEGWPIPGTQVSLPKDPCICGIVELTGAVMTPDVGEEQVFHKNGLRFFYRTDCETGRILPNSMFISKKHPGGNVLEWKKIVATP